MTQRERLGSGGVTEAAARPPAGPEVLTRPGSPSTASHNPVVPWTDIYHSASPAQQRELLSLARGQGLLYFHQLPPLRNGSRAVEPTRLLGPGFLNGRLDDLEPVHSPPLPILDEALDALQREAVARAVQTPDFCLLQGLPGTGKSRVVAEIITQAALRGERILLLAFSPAAIDRILEMIGSQDAICPIRCVAPDERIATLPPCARALTFEERVKHLSDYPRSQVHQQANAAEQAYRRRLQDEPILLQLQELASRLEGVAQQIEALQHQASRVADEVEREEQAADGDNAPANFFTDTCRNEARLCRQSLAEMDSALADGQRRIEERQQRQAELAPRLQKLRLLVAARQQRRWWTAAWWQAWRRHLVPELAELEAQEREMAGLLEAGTREVQGLTDKRRQAENDFQAARGARIRAEVARRLALVEDSEAALRQEQRLLQDKWQILCRQLEPESVPAAATAEASRGAFAAWRRLVERDREQWLFAQQLTASLDADVATVAERLPGYVNLVAATTAALPADEHFGEASPHARNFDLLVLQEADQVTESEFLSFAGRARRWVLVGEPDGAADKGREASRLATVSRPRLPASLRPVFFQRLWQQLHCDPRRLPYAWIQEKDRLCCRLRPLTPEQHPWVESERVADSPDIELRILTLPRMPPALVEVVFPSGMTIAQAKAYICTELEELPVTTPGHSLYWIEEADRVVLRLASEPASGAVPVPLQPGICERVVATGSAANGSPAASTTWFTSQIEFERSAGWTRPGAEKWIRGRLGLQDLGRTLRLDVPYRPQPGLAAFLSDLLFAGAYRREQRPSAAARPADGAAQSLHVPCLNGGACAAVVEFVPVPPLVTEESPGRPEHRRARILKGGAGLELDLADRRHRDRLPAELRPGLPDEGLVNYLEAQAVVRALETLAAAPAPGSVAPARASRPAIAVMALYPAQVELIRCLVQQAPGLARAGLDVTIDVPAAFHEREYSVTLLSLTRSHTHRAVSFGDGPGTLVLALTRARAKLILVGDPGTLARRCQWEGPLDHLDDAAAAHERELVSHLVRYLQGQGPHQQVFHMCQGSTL